MLCFVMALKSPAVSANWSAVETLFEQTLTSVCNQEDPDFQVIVVCNQVPRLKRSVHHSVQFLVKDLPVPDIKARHPSFNTETMLDKWTKLAHGLVVASDFRPDFVMIMDADDLVSCRLAGFVNQNKASNGWIFKQGYYWRYGMRWMQWSEHFNCGTNSIVNSRFINFPKEVNKASMQDCLVLKNGHTTIEEAMRERGTPLEPLPFPGAVWVSGHGENDSALQGEDDGHGTWHGVRPWLGSIRRRRFMSSFMKREFGLDR